MMQDAWPGTPVGSPAPAPAAPRRAAAPAPARARVMPAISFADDIDALTRTAIGEAGNQGPVGMRSVAAVALNRARSRNMTPQQVVLERNQFEPWGNAETAQGLLSIRPDDPRYIAARREVEAAMAGDDPTGGADHFYAPKAQAALGRAAPSWADGQQPTVIGDHNFYRLGGAPDDVQMTAGPAASGEWPGEPASPLDDLNIHRPDQWDPAAAAEAGYRPETYTGPGSSRENPFVVRDDPSREYNEQLQNLRRGMWVTTPDGVKQLTGDAHIRSDNTGDTAVGQARFHETNAGDNARAFTMAAAEQVPLLDEAAVAAAGLINGEGYSATRDSYRAAQDIDNQTSRGYRVAGGLTGAGAMMLAPGVGQAGSFIRAGTGALNQTARAATVGGGSGLLFGAANTDGGLEDRAAGGLLGLGVGMATGGLLDAGGQSAIRGAQRRFAAGPSPARSLSRQGVDLTPGQAAGGALRRIEDGLTSVPILGDAIRGAQRRGLASFDNVATNTAIEPIGVNIANTAGRQGVRMADDAISNAYTQALTGTTYAMDAPATAALTRARRPDRLTPDLRRNLNAVLDNTLERLSAGPVTGDVWKQVDSELAAAARAAAKGSASAPEQRILRDRLQEAREAVAGAMERANPDAFAAVRAADRASAQYRLVRKASSDVASAGRGGDASPATLNRAVVAAGGERQAARGESLLQDLTDDAMQVLPSTVPDSGSALRGLLSLGTLGAGGVVGLGADPLLVGGTVAGLGAASTLYGPTAQKLFNAIYRSTDRQSARSALGELQRLASQNPALQAEYEAAARHVLGSSENPSPAPAPEARGLLSPTGR